MYVNGYRMGSMIIIDVRTKGEELTLRDCANYYEEIDSQWPNAPHVKYLPDEIWITEWQHEHIFSSRGGKWEYWRGIPIKAKKTTEELIAESEDE